MQPFTFHTPTRISFGAGGAAGTGDVLTDLGAARPLLVTDVNLHTSGVLESVLHSLRESGLNVTAVFDQVPADSDIDAVRRAVSVGRASSCDSIIAVGGGSVLDTAKVANIGLSLDGDVLESEGINTLSAPLLPFIAIPTTAGTGSEVSAVAMIKDHAQRKKLLFGSRFLFPDVAILDPQLLVSLPARLTAATGMDALTHALESFVATTKNSPSDALCLEAMKSIFSSLPLSTADGGNIEARSSMLVASTMAGLAFTNAGVGIVHALAHAIGGAYGTHHGVTNAILLPYGMEFNLPEVSAKFAMAYQYLGVALKSGPEPARNWFSTTGGGSAEELIEAVRQLNEVCKIPSRLRDIGVPELSPEQMVELAETAITDPALMFNPQPASEEDLVQLIKRAY